MKKFKTCPKCNSTDLVRISGGYDEHSNNLSLGNPVFSLVKINRYICCSCGYTEEWIDQKDLEKILLCKNAKKQQ